MPLPRAPSSPSDAVEAARILRAKSPLTPADFRRLDSEAKKRAITVTDEVSLDAIRSMRDALAKAKADGIEYGEFVKTVGPTLHAKWGIDSPQLKTVFVNNVQQATNQAIVARLNRQRGTYPYWTIDVVEDEVTSSYCEFFVTYPLVLPAGHAWFETNAPMRHHRCRSTLRGLTAAEAKEIGITGEPPDWPAQDGWGGSAPMGAYKASDHETTFTMADRYAHIDFTIPKGVRAEAKRGLDWRKEHGRGGTSVGVATARTLVSASNVSPEKARHIARYFPRHEVDKKGKGWSPGEDGFPSNGRIAWALWGGDAGRGWSSKLVKQMDAANRKSLRDEPITMPFPNEHAARQTDPGKYERFRRGKPEGFPAGLSAIYGITKDGKVEVQSIRAKRTQWTLGDFRAWLKKNGFKSSIEEASTDMKSVKADLGPADVHIDGPMRVRKVKARQALKAKAMAKTKANGGVLPPRRGLAFKFSRHGTSIEVRHMSDRTVQCAGVEIDTTLLDASDGGEPPIQVWNQLAKCGEFRGHPAGPFELTPQIFTEIVQNFRATQNKRIPIDFEHASEQDPTNGAIPHIGAPAQGWIVDLDNRGAAGLWGLVEWLEPARTYIREGKYKFFSPAIRFGAKDRVSGQPIGARMTSGALTNNPFLDGMRPLAASDREAREDTETINMGDYAYSMAEVMPRLRIGLFEPGSDRAMRATMAECYDALCRMEGLVAEYREMNPDGDLMGAQHAGIPLGAELARLRDALQMGMGITVPEMLALVKEMIEHAMGMHIEEMHPEDDAVDSAEMRDTMADKPVELRDAETKIVALTNEKSSLEARLAGLELQLADRAAKTTALEAEVKALRDQVAARQAQDEQAAVDAAFATYKDSHRLTDVHKQQMLLTYRSDRTLFEKLYPAVSPQHRHLMRDLGNAGGSGRPTPEQGAAEARAIFGNGGLSPEGMIELADKIQREKGCSREIALAEAHKQAAPNSLRRRNGMGPYPFTGG